MSHFNSFFFQASKQNAYNSLVFFVVVPFQILYRISNTNICYLFRFPEIQNTKYKKKRNPTWYNRKIIKHIKK